MSDWAETTEALIQDEDIYVEVLEEYLKFNPVALKVVNSSKEEYTKIREMGDSEYLDEVIEFASGYLPARRPEEYGND